MLTIAFRLSKAIEPVRDLSYRILISGGGGGSSSKPDMPGVSPIVSIFIDVVPIEDDIQRKKRDMLSSSVVSRLITWGVICFNIEVSEWLPAAQAIVYAVLQVVK